MKIILLVIMLFSSVSFSNDMEYKQIENNSPISIKEAVCIKEVQPISDEEMLIEKVLDSISKRETKAHIYPVACYKMISPTKDYGKYQINWIHFSNGGLCYGINEGFFLSSPELQENIARKLMAVHIKIIKQYRLPITESRLHKSWFGIGYALN